MPVELLSVLPYTQAALQAAFLACFSLPYFQAALVPWLVPRTHSSDKTLASGVPVVSVTLQVPVWHCLQAGLRVGLLWLRGSDICESCVRAVCRSQVCVVFLHTLTHSPFGGGL